MKKILLFVLTLGFYAANAQNDILDARTNYNVGQTVTVSGVVTNGAELGTIRYLEDGTAGIAIYDNSFSPNRDDTVTVTGELVDYNGLLEISNLTASTNHGAAQTPITPNVYTPAQIGESTEGQLVRIEDAIFSAGGGTFASGTYTFTSNSEQGVIYVSSASALNGTLIPVGQIDLIGMSSQFTFSQPANDGYQIIPRDLNDLVATSSINFTTGVSQTNITTSSFDLEWGTDVNGTSEVEYGLTTGLELGFLSTGGTNTTHSVSLTGLNAGEIYYARAFSVNGSDTVFSSVGAYATISNSSGDITVYFNQDVDNTVSTGTNAESLGAFTNDTVAAIIGRAQNTLDIAVYNCNDATIVNAINAAHQNGVEVRYITEGANANLGLSSLDPAINVHERLNATGSGMHNKFVIIDADDPNRATVLTGSLNWTSNNIFDDNNNLVLVQDQSLAKAYRIEFEEMWGSNTTTPDAMNSKFGADKSDNSPHNFIIGGKDVELYFSPTDGTTSEIIESIESTNTIMNFATFVFTENGLGDAVETADITFGVSVKGMIEDINVNGSEYQDLVNAGVNVQHHSIPHSLHHKYAIIDHSNASSDPQVITGSHNWSASAESTNDENTIIIHDETVANLFYQEWSAMWNNISSGVDELNAPEEVAIYPNPTNDIVNITYDLSEGGLNKVKITDMQGRVVFNETIQAISGFNKVLIDLSDQAAGMYALTIEGETFNVSKRISVNK